MRTVDSHQHFWRIDRGDYGWLTPQVGPIYRDCLPEHLAPQLARAVVAKNRDDVAAHCRGLARRHKDVERRGNTKTTGTQFTADGDVETVDLGSVNFLERRRQREILRLGVSTNLFASGDRNVELSW